MSKSPMRRPLSRFFGSSVAARSRRQTDPFARYVRIGAVLLFPVLGIVGAFGLSPQSSTIEAVPIQSVTENIPLDPETIAASAPDAGYWVEGKIQRGDTIASALKRLQVADPDAETFLINVASKRKLLQLVPGRSIGARVDSVGHLLDFVYRGDPKAIRFERAKDGTFVESFVDLDRRVEVRSGEIQSSLFAATDQAGIPDGIANEFADIFANEVDLHRDLRSGDRFSVVYEMMYADNEPVRSGRILAAEFTVQGKRLQAIYFERPNGRGDYFSPDGKNFRPHFLRSPIEFSRITSGFSLARFHPILQVWRAHKGIDFGAPIGTKVKATADGVVAFLGWKHGYGRTIALKHSQGLSTLYAHMSAYARGLRVGSEVSQGDVIGYVGMSGLATGPHLHYEFHVHGVHVDPMKTKYAQQPGEDIRGPYRDAFLTVVRARVAQLDLVRQIEVAAGD